MAETLADQERYDDPGKPHFCFEDEEETYYFIWNGVYGDPIQVIQTGEVTDLIPTTMSGDAPKETAQVHLQFFELLCLTYLKRKKNGGEVSITLHAEGVEDVSFVMDEKNNIVYAESGESVARKEAENAGTTFEEVVATEQSQQQSVPDLSRFFPDEESPR